MTYLTRRTLPSGTHYVPMATDAAPTFGFDYHGENDQPVVFISLVTKANNYRVMLDRNAALQALRSWANYALDQGMISPIDLGVALSTVPQVEHLVRTLLDELSDTMINRIIAQVRKRVDESELEHSRKETDELAGKVCDLEDKVKTLTDELEHVRNQL